MIYLITLQAHADQCEAVQTLLSEMIERSREMPGCAVFEGGSVDADPTRFVLYERWVSAQAAKENEAAPHFRAFLTEVKPRLQAPPSVQVLVPLGSA
ncbi:MAG: putative monooxygenase [Rhodospirillales bacterium]|jgi:quinol monooxygenase YgiN|nr:putative monooxygenase [Rhodospirillales bacterium]